MPSSLSNTGDTERSSWYSGCGWRGYGGVISWRTMASPLSVARAGDGHTCLQGCRGDCPAAWRPDRKPKVSAGPMVAPPPG